MTNEPIRQNGGTLGTGSGTAHRPAGLTIARHTTHLSYSTETSELNVANSADYEETRHQRPNANKGYNSISKRIHMDSTSKHALSDILGLLLPEILLKNQDAE